MPTDAVRNLLFSFLRTLVPAGVSGLLNWLALRTNFIVDEGTKQQLMLLAYGVTFGLYYALVRVLETYVAPAFSWFLGDFRKGLTVPTYPDQPPPAAAEVQPAAEDRV